MLMTLFLSFLITFGFPVSFTVASTFTDLNKLNPQIPNTSNPPIITNQLESTSFGGSDFFTSPPNKLDPFQATDGSEIKPDYDGANWNRRDPMFNNINPMPMRQLSQTDDWFPSITAIKRKSSNTSGSNSSAIKSDELPNYREFMDKVSVINANNFFTSTPPYRRDLKLLSLVYNLMSATTRELNILHLGTGSGYVPLALAIFGQHNDTVVSLGDEATSTLAGENIVKDGKQYFLRKLHFGTIDNIPNSPINRASNGRSFDLVVFSKSVPRDYSFPSSLISVMNPKGYLIYPEEGKRLKIDRLDGNGKFTTTKSI